MSLQDHPRAYGAAALVTAFAAGILVTLGSKDLYPDLERRFQAGRKRNRTTETTRNDLSLQRTRSRNDRLVELQDHEGTHQSGRPDIADGIAACIGNTPLVRIASLSDATGCDILAKAEFLNPGGSPKDRVALALIRAGEASGQLRPHRGDTIYEGTSGSTGISLATLAAGLGYKAHICLPADVAQEKSRLLEELGAVVERVPVAPIVDPNHFVNLARRRAQEHAQVHKQDGSRGYFADQFETPANAEAHRHGTGPEIFHQLGDVAPTAFVCGAGTAGTLTGVARFFKEDAKTTTTKIVAADPQGSGLLNLVQNGVLYADTEREGTRRRSQVDSIVEGIGINRMTATLEHGIGLVDNAVRVSDDQACRMARWLVTHDGIFAGSSTAVNCVAAVVVALSLPPGSTVVTLLCDTGLRHMSKFYRIIDEMEEPADNVDLLSLLGLQGRDETQTQNQ